MSNFGLTFRNSKWSDYAIKNVSMTSLNSFTRLIRNIMVLILLVIFTSSYTYYYNYNLTYNNLTYIFWSFVEDLNYLITYSFWSLTFSISFLLRVIYNNSFAFIYGIKNTDHNSSTLTSTLTHRVYKPSKDLRSPILMSFLTHTNNTTVNNHLLENLFSQEQVNKSWSSFYQSFKTLYSTNHLLNNLGNSSNLTNNANFTPSTSWEDLNIQTYNNLNTLPSEVSSIRTSLLNSPSTSSWNLYSFSNEINKYNSLIVGKRNSFYLNNFNFNVLNNLLTSNPELSFLSQSLLDQTKVVKWNRWLYRYNVLHRKTVKNSHKLTMVKKLISTGFYDSSLMSNNLWASNFFSKTTKNALDRGTLDMLHSQFNLLYKDTLMNKYLAQDYNNTLTFTSPTSPLTMLRHFEKSYFWFVKRFYMYNTLNTNMVTSTIMLNPNVLENDSNINMSETYTKYSLLLNTLTKSASLTNGVLNPTYSALNITNATNTNVANSTKDVTLVINDWDVLTMDNLEILNNFSNVITNNNTDLTFFNPTSYSTPLSQTSLTFNPKMQNSRINLISTTNFLNADVKLLSDMYLLNLIMK